MGLDRTDSLAVLDALTPAPGWETDLALFSSYSVDLVAVAAIVVALAGEGDNHERMRDASLARACERMRDRFRVVCQAGRVAVPSSGASTLVIADRWLREVRHDGNERSWHAKLALVRYRSIEAPDNEAEWRLWIGSRNLTRDTSWDSALTALGRFSGASDSIDRSVARTGAVLADKAELPGWLATDVEGELRKLHWEWPEEMEVVSFAMWPDAQPATGFPKAPRGLSHVVRGEPFRERFCFEESVEMGPPVDEAPVADDSRDVGRVGGSAAATPLVGVFEPSQARHACWRRRCRGRPPRRDPATTR